MAEPTNQSNTNITAPIRVMLVDDSAVVRGLLTRVLEEDPEIKVIYTAANGEMAVNNVIKQNPDILILDIEMPVMDGITALPLLLRAVPDLKILMCSTLSLRNAEITLKALELGATDTIAKPTAAGNIIGSGNDFKANLVNLVKTIAKSRVRKQVPTGQPASVSGGPAAPKIFADHSFKLRDEKSILPGKPSIVAIGSSTGGPQALFEVMKSCQGFNVPIVITQHMPATFTAMLAKHISQNSGVPTEEGKEGDILQPGHAYVAPGSFHMTIHRDNDKNIIRLNADPPENFCRPAVDPMFRSLIPVYGGKILSVILTGMGSDGLQGSRAVVEAGGRLIAQDEPSSVVWGMPGAVATAGLCHSVLPLREIGPTIKRSVMGF